MTTLQLFEMLANTAHYHTDVKSLAPQFPREILTSILSNDAENLKIHLSNKAYLANESHVVQI